MFTTTHCSGKSFVYIGLIKAAPDAICDDTDSALDARQIRSPTSAKYSRFGVPNIWEDLATKHGSYFEQEGKLRFHLQEQHGYSGTYKHGEENKNQFYRISKLKCYINKSLRRLENIRRTT